MFNSRFSSNADWSGRIFRALMLATLFLGITHPLMAVVVPAGDIAPYGARNGVFNAGDLVVLQRMILGELTPTATESFIADVAPIGSPNGVLDLADYLVLMRALNGDIALSPVELGPEAPTSLTAAPVSDSRIDLNWAASVHNGGGIVAAYNIYRDGGGMPIATVTATSYSDTGLTASTVYNYSIAAFDNAVPANESASADTSATTFAPPVTAAFLDAGAQWSYLDDGSDQGTAWRAPGFDDSGWATGTAQLGYGDGDETTAIGYGPDPVNKYITSYFRTSFTITDAAKVLDLTLNLLRDDGAVVYVNGTEVARSNMPLGAIDYTTLAAAGVGGVDESTFFASAVAPALLVTGTNVVAVEVHQFDGASSDLSIELSLTGNEYPIQDREAPTIPMGLNGVASGFSQVDLSWAASSDSGGGSVAGYNLYRDGGATPIATVIGTAYSDAGLATDTAFSYTVSAFDTGVPANESLQSAAVVVTTGTVDNAAPDAPTGLTVTAVSDSRIDLSWTASVDNGGGVVTGYNIFRDGGSTPIATVTGTSYFDTGLTTNTFYNYSVTAFDNAVPANESASADVSASTFSAAASISIIQQGAAWTFLDDGSDQGTAWRAPGFDDSSWASGSAELGYGDGDEATIVSFGPDANNKYITTYFRRSFEVEDALRALDLTLSLLRDDGAVVYLNGTEVARSNMPGGPIDSSTLAVSGMGGGTRVRSSRSAPTRRC